MEADWEIEVGPDAPVMDVCWPGFIDLRIHPEAAASMPEAAGFSPLADALVRLNESGSPVWTSKCDLWQPDTFDADELDASAEARDCAVACYVDLLPRPERRTPRPSLDAQISICILLSARLRAFPLRCCRVDLVIRRAFLPHEIEGFGITAYFTACASANDQALATLGSALAVFADTVLASGTPGASTSKYNQSTRASSSNG